MEMEKLQHHISHVMIRPNTSFLYTQSVLLMVRVLAHRLHLLFLDQPIRHYHLKYMTDCIGTFAKTPMHQSVWIWWMVPWAGPCGTWSCWDALTALRLSAKKSACEYCTITSQFASVDGKSQIDVSSIPLCNINSVDCVGNGSIRPMMIWGAIGPLSKVSGRIDRNGFWDHEDWCKSRTMGLRVARYEWWSSEDSCIGVRWFIWGLMGRKVGTHPSLDIRWSRQLHCRRHGLVLNLGFVSDSMVDMG